MTARNQSTNPLASIPVEFGTLYKTVCNMRVVSLACISIRPLRDMIYSGWVVSIYTHLSDVMMRWYVVNSFYTRDGDCLLRQICSCLYVEIDFFFFSWIVSVASFFFIWGHFWDKDFDGFYNYNDIVFEKEKEFSLLLLLLHTAQRASSERILNNFVCKFRILLSQLMKLQN